ncbi:hypothetical protein C8K30_110235 [Promicromonospora sp. AC04]|nr:hypothetical protein C8K30_110235 [Promicromonospora sp. AC04]
MNVTRSIILFVAAAVFEIGGAWHVRPARDRRLRGQYRYGPSSAAGMTAMPSLRR